MLQFWTRGDFAGHKLRHNVINNRKGAKRSENAFSDFCKLPGKQADVTRHDDKIAVPFLLLLTVAALLG